MDRCGMGPMPGSATGFRRRVVDSAEKEDGGLDATNLASGIPGDGSYNIIANAAPLENSVSAIGPYPGCRRGAS